MERENIRKFQKSSGQELNPVLPEQKQTAKRSVPQYVDVLMIKKATHTEHTFFLNTFNVAPSSTEI
jgi:hypothetical protein